MSKYWLRSTTAWVLLGLISLATVASNNRPSHAAMSSGALFLNQERNTASASLQIDPAGGLYAAYVSDPQEEAYYSYCAPSSDCDLPTNWSQTSIGQHVREVQLELTPAGHPRMLLLINDPDDGDPQINDSWWYAACDRNCINSANWGLIMLGGHADIDTESFYSSNHYFALDQQGHPRAVFGPNYDFDPDTFEVYGYMSYAACDSDCLTPTSWSLNRINAVFHQPALAFSSAGQPRIAAFADANDGAGSDILEYISCDSDCSWSGQWTDTPIGQPGVGPESVVLRLDSRDRPRMATFFNDGHSHYIWCNSGCLSASQWGDTPIDPADRDGGDPDLRLDGQDRPRIAFHWQDASSVSGAQAGLGYAWCDTNCETSSALFQRRLADDSSRLDTDWPLPYPDNCMQANWLAGYRPALALDAAGQPWIAADADFVAFGCVGVPEPGHGLPIGSEKTHEAVRLAFGAPIGPQGQYHSFLPVIQR